MTIKSVTNGHTLHAVRWHARAIGPEGRRAMPQEALTHCGARHGLSHSCPGAECKETPAVHTGGPDPHPRSGRQVSRRVRGAAGALGGGGQRHADWGGDEGAGARPGGLPLLPSPRAPHCLSPRCCRKRPRCRPRFSKRPSAQATSVFGFSRFFRFPAMNMYSLTREL